MPAASVLLSVSTAGAFAEGTDWPDTPLARLEAFALIKSLDVELLSHDSATLVLESWCAARRLADRGHVVAERVRDVAKPATPEIRQRLGVDAAAPVGYRRVRLKCGDKVLSEADNWYVPSRLSAEMNRTLDATDTSFGRVVQPLHFTRRTLSSETLWTVLPEGWDTGDATPAKASCSALSVPDFVLRHTATLTLPEGTPFSLVVESYTRAVLAFPRPRIGIIEPELDRCSGGRQEP